MRLSGGQVRRWLSSLLLGAGALALLTPLASWGAEAWGQHRMLSRFERANPAVRGWVGPGQAAPPTQDAPARAPDPDPDPAIPPYRITIPAAGIDYMVLEGIEDEPLTKGPGHYPATPLPGARGNAAIAGHRTVKGRPSFFYDLALLRPGDLIVITYADRSLNFAVERVFLTSPYDISVLSPTPDPALTLTTCDPPGLAERRLIIRARSAFSYP